MEGGVTFSVWKNYIGESERGKETILKAELAWGMQEFVWPKLDLCDQYYVRVVAKTFGKGNVRPEAKKTG